MYLLQVQDMQEQLQRAHDEMNDGMRHMKERFPNQLQRQGPCDSNENSPLIRGILGSQGSSCRG